VSFVNEAPEFYPTTFHLKIKSGDDCQSQININWWLKAFYFLICFIQFAIFFLFNDFLQFSFFDTGTFQSSKKYFNLFFHYKEYEDNLNMPGPNVIIHGLFSRNLWHSIVS
jgi:hypothetical protein